jgi:hypothetical protein
MIIGDSMLKMQEFSKAVVRRDKLKTKDSAKFQLASEEKKS